MSSLMIDVPDDLLDRLRRSAERSGRDLSAEAIVAFEHYVGPEHLDHDALAALIRAARDPWPGATPSPGTSASRPLPDA